MLTGVIPTQKRSTAFGLFGTGFGVAWFAGSAIMGLLYDKSVVAVALFSTILQLAAILVIFVANQAALISMNPYAKPKERKTGAQRPKIRHAPQSVEPRTPRERKAEKEAVAAERRAIKKAARRHLKEQLLREVEGMD